MDRRKKVVVRFAQETQDMSNPIISRVEEAARLRQEEPGSTGLLTTEREKTMRTIQEEQALRDELVHEKEQVLRSTQEKQELSSLLAEERENTARVRDEEQALRASLEDEREKSSQIRREMLDLKVLLAAEKEKTMRSRQRMDTAQPIQTVLGDEAGQRAYHDVGRHGELLAQHPQRTVVYPPTPQSQQQVQSRTLYNSWDYRRKSGGVSTVVELHVQQVWLIDLVV